VRRALVLAAFSVVTASALSAATPARAQAAEPIVDGAARFEVITPSLVRLEYAAAAQFEDRRTVTTDGRLPTNPRFETEVRGAFRIIRTSRLTLRWRRDSGPFAAGNLQVRVGKRKLRPAPGPNPAPLGGWRRSLDLVDGPVPLHEGMLSRTGWYLLDDSETAVIAGDGFETRPAHEGAYQDLYLFAYGRDYLRGLRDLRKLTGPAPLPPRKAFGVWFSRWWPYGEGDWREIVARFRDERVPLDTISVDTDFKRVHDPGGAAIASEVVGAPGGNYSWNGWDWNRELYPNPARFLRWARAAGLEVGLNIHPSINSRDPRFAEAQSRAGGGLTEDPGCRVVQADPNGLCMVFDWADPRQLDAYFSLHELFERDGPVFWWLDWCCDGSRVSAPGLAPDTWINRQYYENHRARGLRWPAFSRIGGSFQAGFGAGVGTGAFAEHRQSIQFTGDTCASWPLLAFAAEYTAAAASIGMPYVSHDIGTFHAVSPSGTCRGDASPILTPRANELPADMYARWVQLGTFQPFDRLHSHHGRRLPWEYEPEIERIASEFLRLRGRLVPYLYSLAAAAHRTGVPMVRALYLQWPRRGQAYRHPSQYTLGRDVLVAPVAEPGTSPTTDVWFPPGKWVDWFTGERLRGPALEQLETPLDRMPVFVRAGAVVPMQRNLATTPAGPPRSLVLLVHRGRGKATYYDDSGRGFAYERGGFTQTTIRQRLRGGATVLEIGRARGRFKGAPARRRYEIKLVGVGRPGDVTVDGGRPAGWRYDRRTRTAIIRTGPQPTRRALEIRVEP